MTLQFHAKKRNGSIFIKGEIEKKKFRIETRDIYDSLKPKPSDRKVKGEKNHNKWELKINSKLLLENESQEN